MFVGSRGSVDVSDSGVPVDVGGLPVDVRISVDVRPVVVVCLVDVL